MWDEEVMGVVMEEFVAMICMWSSEEEKAVGVAAAVSVVSVDDEVRVWMQEELHSCEVVVEEEEEQIHVHGNEVLD